MAENNQNEPTYDADSYTGKKGRPRTYALAGIETYEAAGIAISPGGTAANITLMGGLADNARKNLFLNNYAGDPLNKNYSYAGFTTSTSYPPPVVEFKRLSDANTDTGAIKYETYNLRAHKKYQTNDSLLAPGIVVTNPGDFTQDLATFEVLLPNNKIDLTAPGSLQPVIDEFTYTPFYQDQNGVSYDFIGEYRSANGIIDFISPVNSLVNLPFKQEYIYCVVQTPKANIGNNDFRFFLPNQDTSAEKKVGRNFLTPAHIDYVLFGEGSVQSVFSSFTAGTSYFHLLSNADKNFIDSPYFTDALENSKGAYFNTSRTYEHVDFISNIPFSPQMVKASGVSVEKMLTADITSQFNFMPPELSEIISSNSFLELEMPNFYNFITAMVAVDEKRFDPQNTNARRLTLGGRLDPSQLLFVGKQYADYQASSQLPPGHAHWDYDNNKSLLDTEFVVQGVDYWQAWAANWTDYNNEKSETNYLPNVEKVILVPFENTNFLTDYNDNITYFPIYNQIEFDAPQEAPLLPYILKNAKADKYIMRCIAASVKSISGGTDEDFVLESFGQVQNNIELVFEQNKHNPPGESADLDTTFEDDESAVGSGGSPGGQLPWYAQGEITSAAGGDSTELVSWDLATLLNGFKIGSDGWTENGFDSFDKDEAFYVGIDVEDGYPFADDLSVGNPNQKFTKSLYAHILEQQLQGMAAQKFVSYNNMQCGSKNYSEIIMYRIHKKSTQDINGETEQDIWMWNTGDIERYVYYDTQISHGHSYEYKVYAYYFVVGNRYRYEKAGANGMLGITPGTENFDTANSFDKAALEISIFNQTTLKIIEVPYFGHEEASQKVVTSTDHPPVPPSVNITPFKNVSDAVSMTLTSNSGEIETNKIINLLSERPEAKDSSGEIVNYLYASDGDVKTLMLQSQNKVDFSLNPPTLKFKSDTLPAFYEVFRIGPEPGETETKPPSSYYNFFDKLHQIIEVDGSSMTIIDDIKENVAYYYTFRARDGAAGYFFSNPTAVYKVQMVKEPGKNVVYPIIEIYDMDLKAKYKMPSKQMTRYMHIKPAYEHTYINEGDQELDSLEMFANKTTVNPEHLSMIPKLGVNNDNYELFSVITNNAKRFKIRLTSKSTGRKIDFNVAFLRKHNQD